MAEVTGKIKRYWMAHFIDAALPGVLTPNYVRLGDDLEEFNVEMNANVETTRNILGGVSTKVDSYEPQASVEPYYAEAGNPLHTRLQKIIDERQTLDDLKTTVVEVHLWEEVEGSAGSYVAYKENAIIEVVSYGGDTTGYQIPFNIHHTGNRVKGKFDVATKTFTADTGTLGTLYIDVIAGSTSTGTKVSDVVGEGSGTLMYKVGSNISAPYYGEASAGYTTLTLDTDITTEAGQYIVVVEVVSNAVVAASAIVPVVVGSV
jgi:hypothetical protein